MRCHLLTTLILLIAPILLIFLPPVLATPIDRTSTSVSFTTAALESSRDALLPEVHNQVDEVVGSTEEDEEVRDEIAVTELTSVEVEDEEQGKEEGDNGFLESPFTSSDEEAEEDDGVDQIENMGEQSDTDFTKDNDTQDAHDDDTVVLKPRQEEHLDTAHFDSSRPTSHRNPKEFSTTDNMAKRGTDPSVPTSHRNPKSASSLVSTVKRTKMGPYTICY